MLTAPSRAELIPCAAKAEIWQLAARPWLRGNGAAAEAHFWKARFSLRKRSLRSFSPVPDPRRAAASTPRWPARTAARARCR